MGPERSSIGPVREMLRISKLTDYGVVLATHLAAWPDGRTLAVRDLAKCTGIPQPTASKVLKLLGRAGIVEAQRGAHGGYRLTRAPEDITIAEVISAVEGPIGVTECATEVSACEFEPKCDVRTNWQRINQAVQHALEGIRLSDMILPNRPELVRIGRAAQG